MLGVISIDPALLDDTVERINITLPKRVLMRLDSKAREAGESRSSYIAKMAVG
jgi:metal-responsive CopG/Arc/MetJ family transcriptional regulator